MKLFITTVICLAARLATAQVQLQFVVPSYDLALRYTRALSMRNGDTLLIGTERVQSDGYLSGATTMRVKMVLEVTGPVPVEDAGTAYNAPVLGGSGNDVPAAAALDAAGNIWIIGTTDSDDFLLVNPIVARKAPYRAAAFVIELDATATKLLFATYLAGSAAASLSSIAPYATSATAVAGDKAGNIYVGGLTNEPDFPSTPGALKAGTPGVDGYGNTYSYSWIAKISSSGKLVYSSITGTGAANCMGSACLSNGSTYASVGSLAADDVGRVTFSGSRGGVFLSLGYVAQLSSDGATLLWSMGPEFAYGFLGNVLVAGDPSGSIDISGVYFKQAISPFTPQQPTTGFFAERVSADGTTTASLDLGQSSGANSIAGMALDARGNVYLAGTSTSPQVPAVAGVPYLGSDFILRLDGASLKPSALVRLPSGTISEPIALDAQDRVLEPGPTMTLLTVSLLNPFGVPGIAAIANSASYALDAGLSPGELITVFGFGFGQNPKVLIDGVAASVLYAGPNQINVQTPFETPLLHDRIEVITDAGTAEATEIYGPRSIGIFTTDGVYAAALNQDGTVNSASNPAVAGSIVTIFGTGAIWSSGLQDGAAALSAMALDQETNQFLIQDVNGAPSMIHYAGAAPGLLYGFFQINFEVQRGMLLPLTLRSSADVASNPVRIYIK